MSERMPTLFEPEDRMHHSHLILELYGAINELAGRLGLESVVTISGFQREQFDEVMDYLDSTTTGFALSDHPNRSVWVKRYNENLIVHTDEPPQSNE